MLQTNMITSLVGIHEPLSRSGEPHWGITEIQKTLDNYPINIEADFQRDRVWTTDQKRDFMGHMLEGGDLTPCIVNTGPNGDWRIAELIDGKQRVTSCLDWTSNRIPARLSDGRAIWFKNLDEPSVRRCGLILGLKFAMVRLTKIQSLELYIKLNRGGTPHTTAEIAKVRVLLNEERGIWPRK